MIARLSVRNLYSRQLGPINLELASGECVGLSGASGAGKSLLLRALADLGPYRGELQLDTTPATAMSAPEWRRRVGYLPAESAWWSERVLDHFHDVDSAAWQQLGVTPQQQGERNPADCSSGERQRLALLRLLQQQPQVLLLDEPTAALDGDMVARVEQRLARFRAVGGAILWVSHDPAQLQRVADRRLQLRDQQLWPLSATH